MCQHTWLVENSRIIISDHILREVRESSTDLFLTASITLAVLVLIDLTTAEREKAFVWHLAGCTYRTRQFGIELPHKSWKIFRLWFTRTCGNRRWVHEGVELKHCNSEGIIPHIRGNATSLQCLSHSVIVKLKLAIIIMVWRIHWKSVLISFLSLIASGQHTQFGTKMYIFVPHSVRQCL